MSYKKTLATSTLVLLSILSLSSLTFGEYPSSTKIYGVPRIKQLFNYCGPAALTAVLQHLGEDITQQTVGKSVYDQVSCATNGADMLLYARNKGYSAYSWNSNINDVKKKLAAGVPVIVLQENSIQDTSGHYRVLTGYDDQAQKFYVMDPYYDDITELSYTKCDKLWRPMGYWGMIVIKPAKDTFKAELNDKNPVVHMDLSYAMYKSKDYDNALKEAKLALDLEPYNDYAQSMVDKINRAIGAGRKK